MIRLLLTLLLTSSLLSAETVEPVWPEGKMPGTSTPKAEAEVPRNDGFLRITNVSQPTLGLFPAPRDDGKPTPAVIICPGGGYRYTVMDKEGSAIAEWLNKAGISGLVLKYRTPSNREGALQDVQRAISLTRANAAAWNIDPEKVGVIGFSAGGNLAAKASTRFEDRTYPSIDKIDEQSCRPDFAVLVYPAYLDDKKGQVAQDLNLEVKIPPTFIVHSEDDKNHVVGSKIYSAALTERKLAHEFKLYPTGGHGYGLHSEGEARAWPGAALQWFRQLDLR
jgi:acetyl esterase/lipase